MAKRAGMDFVTLTDHETIDGSLTLLHHPDFLVGELLLYVGRVSKEKGLERLLPRYLDLRSRRQDVHLVVVGDGPYREEMESALGSYPPGGLSPNFRFTAFSKVRTGWR